MAPTRTFEMKSIALKLSGVQPRRLSGRVEQKLPAESKALLGSLVVDMLQLQQITSAYPIQNMQQTDLDNRLVRDMQAIAALKGKNDSAVDLATWPEPDSPGLGSPGSTIAAENAFEAAFAPLSSQGSTTVAASDMASKSFGSLHHEPAHMDVSDADDSSDESDFAPEHSGEEEEDPDFADDDYTEPGRSKRSLGLVRRKAESLTRHNKEAKRPKTIKKALTRGKEPTLLTVADEEFEQDGFRCVKFGYTNKGKQTVHVMRVDIEDVDEDSLTEEFKEIYCVYPKALCSREEYRGSRWNYETECNKMAWKLSYLNLSVFPSGQRGLLQRAVDVYRNMFHETKSRRVQRQVKNCNLGQGSRTVAETRSLSPELGPRAARRGRPTKLTVLPSRRSSVQSLSELSSSTAAPRSSISFGSPVQEEFSEDDCCDQEDDDEMEIDPLPASYYCAQPQRIMPPQIQIQRPLEPARCFQYVCDPLPDHIVEQIRAHMEAHTENEFETMDLFLPSLIEDPLADSDYFADLMQQMPSMSRTASPLLLSPEELLEFDAIMNPEASE